MNYIICELDEPDDNEEYVNDVEEVIAIAPLTDDAFEHDNKQDCLVIKGLILEDPAWSFITKQIHNVKNRTEAWKVLCSHYEGKSFMNRQIDECYNTIDLLYYRKELAAFPSRTSLEVSPRIRMSWNNMENLFLKIKRCEICW